MIGGFLVLPKKLFIRVSELGPVMHVFTELTKYKSESTFFRYHTACNTVTATGKLTFFRDTDLESNRYSPKLSYFTIRKHKKQGESYMVIHSSDDEKNSAPICLHIFL